MKDKVLKSILLRPGMSEQNIDLLDDLIDDALLDIKSYLNYASTNDLPEEIAPAVKELVLIRFNRDGAEGIYSESQSSGGSTTYSDALPDHVRRIIRKYRKLPR